MRRFSVSSKNRTRKHRDTKMNVIFPHSTPPRPVMMSQTYRTSERSSSATTIRIGRSEESRGGRVATRVRTRATKDDDEKGQQHARGDAAKEDDAEKKTPRVEEERFESLDEEVDEVGRRGGVMSEREAVRVIEDVLLTRMSRRSAQALASDFIAAGVDSPNKLRKGIQAILLFAFPFMCCYGVLYLLFLLFVKES